EFWHRRGGSTGATAAHSYGARWVPAAEPLRVSSTKNIECSSVCIGWNWTAAGEAKEPRHRSGDCRLVSAQNALRQSARARARGAHPARK
ncbi:unnamed protein product, partial [Ectocarpus sp. 13 AM-2016]